MKIFGIIAMALVQGSTLFQILHFYQRKHTAGVSIGFWWTVYIGLMCYLVYAISIKDWIYIVSNSIGIILSSISIIMYYYYRKVEEDGNCDCGMGADSDVHSAGVGSTDQPAKTGGHHSGRRAVFSEVPLRRGRDNDSGSRPPCKNIHPLPKTKDVVIANICTDCQRFWVNDQGWPRYINLEEVGEMIIDGAVKRFAFCPQCKDGRL